MLLLDGPLGALPDPLRDEVINTTLDSIVYGLIGH
jgi:hypothetical protein